jgi:hypothetical protein
MALTADDARIVEDWLAGTPIPILLERYGKPRRDLYQLLRESGVPTSNRLEHSTTADMIIAELHDLVLELAMENDRLTQENQALKRSARVRSRVERNAG